MLADDRRARREKRAEVDAHARMSRQELAAPVDGVVWRSTVAQGTEILRGAPLFKSSTADTFILKRPPTSAFRRRFGG